MLTRAQRQRVRERGISVHHDHWFTSLACGEAFLEDGLLAYFDGRVVRLIGIPLQGAPRPSRADLRAAAHRWAVDRQAEALMFVGPEPVDFGPLARHGFKRIALRARRPWSAELRLPADRERWGAHLRRTEARAGAHGLSASVRRAGSPRAERLRLLERFYRREPTTIYLADLAFSIAAALQSRRVWVIEARRRGQLVGFLALHHPFADSLLGLFLVHDGETRGVSDFLFARALALAARAGAAFVNVGPSPSRGHYAFKRKWGGRVAVPPYYEVDWARGNLARRAYWTFGPRLVGLR